MSLVLGFRKKKETYDPAFTGRVVEEVTPLGRSRRQPLPLCDNFNVDHTTSVSGTEIDWSKNRTCDL